jgi:FkbM family methyltransferase
MTSFEERISNALLRYAAPVSVLRRTPVLGSILRRVGHRLFPSERLTWVQILDGPARGLWIRLNPHTGYNFYHGIGEPRSEEAMQQHLHPGMTFYDLGANIGFLSLIAARLVGPTGKVISFEADPENALRLRENLARNKFAHASVVEQAVWSESGAISFARVDSKQSPDRGTGHVASETTSDTISIPAVSLDDFIKSHTCPDFVKCDVEGSEVAVFQGAGRLLREVRPILLVETHSLENHRLVTENFLQLHYACKDLDGNHILALPNT